MTIRRCMNCGNPFSTRITKLENFCSVECEYTFKNKQLDNKDWQEVQMDIDFKAIQEGKANDYRLLRR